MLPREADRDREVAAAALAEALLAHAHARAVAVALGGGSPRSPLERGGLASSAKAPTEVIEDPREL